jgi:ABC-type Fe3+/spermidine/putrescine transport system ATPase subunit
MTMSDVVVVMRSGCIEQVGAPDDIYVRPRSQYVATFMGYANHLTGTILGQDGASWIVQTAGGLRLAGVSTVPVSWQAGHPVTLCFRPDDTLTEPLPATNQLHGQVQLVEYLGHGFEAVVSLEGEGGQQLLVQSPTRPETQAPVAFGIRPERLLLFSDAETTAMPDQRNGQAAPERHMLAERR